MESQTLTWLVLIYIMISDAGLHGMDITPTAWNVVPV